MRTQTPPNYLFPKVNVFVPGDFDAALWGNGYEVLLESAIACPCNTGSAAHPNCGNCMGTGWTFINPIETRSLITSINKDTKYKDWSPEMIGTIAATFMKVNRFGFMDRITLLKNFSYHSETRSLLSNTVGEDTNYFIFCTYKIKEIESVFIFDGDTNALIKLEEGEYSINENNPFVLDLLYDFAGYVGKISITYRHNVTYNIVDIPHDMRMTWNINNNGTNIMEEMPIQAIARKSQYELGAASNYEGNNVFNNSYK